MIKFKPLETKAAILLISELRKKVQQARSSGDTFADKSIRERDVSPESSEIYETWSIQCYMEAQLLMDSIDDLEESIINQSFNF